MAAKKKLKQYTVTYHRFLTYEVEVEAETPDAAVAKVYSMSGEKLETYFSDADGGVSAVADEAGKEVALENYKLIDGVFS